MKSRPDVLEWYTKAENDFKAACDLAERKDDPLPDLVCFHCQQACEKYIKAVLVSQGQSPPPIHDLDALLDLCTEQDSSFETIRENIEPLTSFAVEYRYPGESAKVEEAEEALQRAKKARDFITKKLGLEGSGSSP